LPILEIACFTLESAISAYRAGANRIEFCENPTGGGTTPSYGLLKQIRSNIPIPIFPIIRPREGDFLYTENEFIAIKYDILLCKSMGFDGVVFGLLNTNGSIDFGKTAKLVELAYPMEVTFHRAFDRCKDPFEALEQLINIGCQRILTSGQKPNAMLGFSLIQHLIKAAENRIIIMPGGGINSNNMSQFKEVGATEFHAAARETGPSNMNFIQPLMDEVLETVAVNTAEVKKMLDLLK
jgi:copper homeostasis protein